LPEMLHLHEAYGGQRHQLLRRTSLNVNPSLVDLMRSIHLQELTGGLRGLCDPDLFTEEQAEPCMRPLPTGCFAALKSAHPRMFAQYETKKSTVATIPACCTSPTSTGLKVKALMSFWPPSGIGSHDSDDARLAASGKPDDFDCHIITTYPAAPTTTNARLQENGLYVFETPR